MVIGHTPPLKYRSRRRPRRRSSHKPPLGTAARAEGDDAARLYEYGLAGDLPEEDFQKAVKRLAILQRRRGDIDEAVKWWERAAGEGQIYAWVELAKHYEHRVKDYDLAEDATHRALSLMNETQNPHARTLWAGELAHRSKRLERKISTSC